MPKRIVKTARTRRERGGHGHRFEHWYVDNQVYFITARCKDQFPAFASEQAKQIFWDRLEHYATQAGFAVWVASLMDNHYHLLGYNRSDEALKKMMRMLHGSVAKLVNDVLESNAPGAVHFSAPLQKTNARLLPFWRDHRGKEFYDGCIRNEVQCTRAYNYVLRQAARARIVKNWHDYPHTRIFIPLEKALPRALELHAFMPEVPYPRYTERPT